MQTDCLNGLGVAVTRPVAQAKKLNALLGEAGAAVIDFPLIEITALDDYTDFTQVIHQLDDYDLMIFISSNAVQNAMPRIVARWPELPATLQFSAIGPVTAEELKGFGVKEVLTPIGRFDSESLLALPALQSMQGKKVMIVRGIGGREVLANTLKTRGASVTFAECYQRVNPQQDCLLLIEQTKSEKCHAIVVTSSEAMRHLVAMAKVSAENVNTHWLGKLKICVNHQRVADEAGVAGLELFVADAPGDAAMLNCLKRALLK
jgi:uroporphyrinogen-III synthase